MQPFVFHNPTRIIFGEGTVPQIGGEARPYGKKILLVYGRASIKRSGLYDRVMASLHEAGLDVIELPGVQPNPVLSHLRKGIALAKEAQVDAVLAVGGGSAIDTAKGIAAGAATDRDVWPFYCRTATVEAALPVLAILTLAATGSEMNGRQVVTNEETQEKFGFLSPLLHPRVSILDPTLTYTVPVNYTAYAAVDAISHLLEGYFTHGDLWTPIQDRYAEGLVKTIMETAERVLADRSDYQGRATMMWAATLAFNGLGIAGVGDVEFPNHMLEHPLSALYDVPHGAGLSVVIPAWMAFMARRNPGRIAHFADAVLGIRSGDDAAKAEQAAGRLRAWFEKIGSPVSFAQAGIPAADLERIVDKTVALSKVWKVTRYSRDDIREMYRLCL